MVVAAALALMTTHAHAQAGGREEAKELFKEANALHDAGDLNGALAKYRAADELAHTPVTALELGKAYGEVGLLLEAEQALLGVAQIPVKPSETDKSKAARVEAPRLAAVITTKIPTLAAVVDGAGSAAVTVTLDGSPWESATTPRRLDPGAHTVVASAVGHSPTTSVVTLAPSEARVVRLTVTPLEAATETHDQPSTAPLTTPPIDSTPQGTTVPPADNKPAKSGGSISPAAWVLGGISLTALIVSGLAGSLAVSDASTVHEHCVSKVCDATGLAAAGEGKNVETVGNVSLVVSGAFLLGGLAVAISVRPKASPAAAWNLGISPSVGGARLSLGGSF